ncbi:hypothetical protein PBCVCVB1_673R [Paramecium bursaria Chlorella virus CVB-1]|nr:hypothetical protein PBCVCVB1_673R [Paramecium bursaria Chlorella virus CVB-1]AGE58109.1 hypothetical protein PBCVNW6652_720L [Paramecium bursaria Chlorella virus NW665.2]
MSDYIKTLEYYFENNKNPVVFSKYTINALDGIIKNKKSGRTLSININKKGYNRCSVTDDDGKERTIRVARAVASTFLGKPPTPLHTADHKKSKQKKNDMLTNIRWLCKPGQANNRIMPETYKDAFIIVKDGIEKTVNEWVAYMNAKKTPKEREFTKGTIEGYIRRKTHGFAYKKYPDLEDERWLEIEGYENEQGRWKISNMNRVKYITNIATENVLWGDRLGRSNGYPIVKINGKIWLCHILAFKTFHPELWAAKKPDEMVRHEDDDKEDFRPHKLHLGTASDNGKDSYANGKYDGTKSSQKKCASYINGVLEKDDYLSLMDAAEYLKTKGYPKANKGNISMALSGDRKTAYGRTWQEILP